MRVVNSKSTAKQYGPFLFFLGVIASCQCQTYANTMAIFEDKLDSSVYDIRVRPLLDQSQVLNVNFLFWIISIVEMDDVSQSFICNGVAFFSWRDQLLSWRPSDYGGQTTIQPLVTDIWRPRVILMNTLDERDIFEDDHSPLFALHDGTVSWAPGGLFPVSCHLDMSTFPFDVQTCYIRLVAMSVNVDEVKFNAIFSTVDTTLYTINGEWDLLSTSVDISNVSVASSVEISITMKRRYSFLLLNILLPVILLSFLNILVFLIPVDSGEKISYGITVLLAVSVFMSIVSEILPSSSDKIPAVTVYLFVLVVISLLTVVVAIIIVFLHHNQQKEKVHQKAKDNYRSVLGKFRRFGQAVAPMNPEPKEEATTTSTILEKMKASTPEKTESPFPSIPAMRKPSQPQLPESTDDNTGQKTKVYLWIVKSIDGISFIVFLSLWFFTNFIFLIYIATA